ncbi:hypothetical protein A3860_13345 [Niastella vici]|uniref:Antitoxin Xre/MbcA/ParS-like toxin-binding domain-containing protein n=1 Tax=Niastella vici TaxID=1703345 RepID=A0A1V9G748_9BACT|nr:antitoxin Xre/MbcA/ParS toxin-binding domain-containing protein [Niastella vici]OQP66469.1 hypothetical protein A3860_13345 [Niastella vici]
MAGNKKPQSNHDVGKGQGHAYTASPTQTGTRQGPAARPTAPFHFNSLSLQYKIGIIRNGITKKQLEAIKSETDFDYHTLSSVLLISRTTLIKKKGDEKFDQPTSERIMRFAEFLSYGREVFESRERFQAWLRHPAAALGGRAPLELLDTLYGIEEVKKELGRIEYGIY